MRRRSGTFEEFSGYPETSGRVPRRYQLNWLTATVVACILIIFVFESIRLLILLIYLPGLLVPKLRHIRDPLHIPIVPFRHDVPVTPIQLVGLEDARAVLRSSEIPRRLHGRFGARRRVSDLFVSTDDVFGGEKTKVRSKLWKFLKRWYRRLALRVDRADELIVDAAWDDREVNREFRRRHSVGWSLENLEAGSGT